MDSLGFHTWISEVKRIERSYQVDIGVSTVESLKQHVKTGVRDAYESFWYENINNVKNNPGLRTYRTINQNLVFQCYLDNISDFRFRKALVQLQFTFPRNRTCPPCQTQGTTCSSTIV